MNNVMKTILFCALLSFAPLAAQAQQAPAVLEKGQTLVTLSATEQKDVQQDELSASLRIELDGKDARVIQDTINKAMKKAVDLAKKEKGVDVTTGQYYVYSWEPTPCPPNADDKSACQRWKGNQTIDLRSLDAEKILDLTGQIQSAGFVMNGLTYGLSAKAAESYKDELMQGALKKIQDKAALVAKTLGKSGYDLVEVNIDGSYMPSPVPMMKAEMAMSGAVAADAMSAPVATPGKSTISMTVSGRVLLRP